MLYLCQAGCPVDTREIEKRRSEIKIWKNEKCKSATTTVSSE
jgi:ribosomal protein L37AE/L43A